MITIGTEASAHTVVREELSAKHMKSGSLLVLATPAMVALMEEAAQAALAPYLEDGQASVGIAINISHDAASPMGAQITATARVSAVEGRKISFDLVAQDEHGPIGKGCHTRFIIDSQKFMDKVNAKKDI